MQEKEAIALAKQNLQLVDAATTEAATLVGVIQTRITDLLAQIAASDNLADAQALAEQTGVVVTKLDGLKTALTEMGTAGVPTPVPEPGPESEPIPGSNPSSSRRV